jgi:heme oxygenase
LRRELGRLGVNMVVQHLRHSTLAIHKRVEANLNLLDPCLTVERLAEVLARFYGFWTVGESSIDAWSATDPASALAVGWDRRRNRSELLIEDLATLGQTRSVTEELRSAPATLGRLGYGEVLGWLYVTEGSTLGGSMIDRHLRTVPALEAYELKSFTPYAEGPGPMWSNYRSALQEYASESHSRKESVERAAVATFESLESWLTSASEGRSP